uniref:C-type lectin domain-containing protein n=1 Tax=Anabas testudineus TaxID=64144 RepID=A0A3Q1HIQ4_ANATE
DTLLPLGCDEVITCLSLHLSVSSPVSLSEFPAGVSRFRPWLFPAATAAVILILIIAVGASSTWTHTHTQTHTHTNTDTHTLITDPDFFSVDNNKDQLALVSDALKQLSVVDTLEKSVASLKCSLERIINNSSVSDGCCPLGWDLFSSSCYFFSPSELNWNDSRDWCVKQEAHLVILKTDKEWDFVTKRTIPDFYWVGLTDGRTGTWEWVNQTPYTMERRYITCDLVTTYLGAKTVCATSARNTVFRKLPKLFGCPCLTHCWLPGSGVHSAET